MVFAQNLIYYSERYGNIFEHFWFFFLHDKKIYILNRIVAQMY